MTGCRKASWETVPLKGDEYLAGVCAGKVRGVMVWAWATKSACIPDTVTGYQAAKVVVQYLDAHPEKLHLDLSLLMFSALTEAFPCKGRMLYTPGVFEPLPSDPYHTVTPQK